MPREIIEAYQKYVNHAYEQGKEPSDFTVFLDAYLYYDIQDEL
jgi:hypothetical protein